MKQFTNLQSHFPRSVLLSLFLLFVMAFGSVQAATIPVQTGFEAPTYTLGPLTGQQDWATTDTVVVQSQEVYGGAQAVELTSQSQAQLGVDTGAEGVVWVEAFCKTTPADEFPILPAPEGVSCLLFFHADPAKGITCLNGDGVGSGTWVYTGIQATEWTRVAIRQDYVANNWDLYVDGTKVLAKLGNAFSKTGFEKFECQAGDTGSMYLDDFYAGAKNPYTTYTLAVTAAHSTVVRTPDLEGYMDGTTVSVAVTPDLGYKFAGWTGDVPVGQEQANPVIMTMGADKVLTATIEQQFALTLVVDALGQVTVDPEKAWYDADEQVVLTATPIAPNLFEGWSGDIPVGEEMTNPLTLTMDASKTVTATFAEPLPRYTLTGTGFTKSPVAADYEQGTSVTITATPPVDEHFVAWTGDVSVGAETVNPLVLNMDANKVITATFEENAEDEFTVTATGPHGSVDKDPPTSVVTSGTLVTLTPTAEAGYVFAGWVGDVPTGQEMDNPLEIVVTSNVVIEATFMKLDEYVLFTLAENGSVTRDPDQAAYLPGTTVTLTPVGAENYGFSGWTGDVDPAMAMDDPLVFVIDADTTITANFVSLVEYYALGVVAENGSVDIDPDLAAYEGGTTITLTATPDAGYKFVGWSGGVTGTDPSATLVIDADTTVTALFEVGLFSVTLVADNGTVTVDPDISLDAVAYGTTITLAATPADGYRFVGWEGGSMENPMMMNVTVDTTVTALFEQILYSLNLTAVNGSVNAAPALAAYAVGAQVELTPVPATGFVFDSWSGDVDAASSGTVPLVIVMDGDKDITANFVAAEYELTIVGDDDGTVVADPNTATYAYGTPVSLTATPDESYLFEGWQVDGSTVTLMDNPLSLTITADTTVRVIFGIVLTIPENVETYSDTDLIEVSWDDVYGAEYYQVYRSDSVAGVKTAISAWEFDTWFEDTTVPLADTPYYYWVKAAVGPNGERATDYSAYAMGIMLSPDMPGAPDFPWPDDEDTDVEAVVLLEWDAENATSYDLYLWKSANAKPAVPTASGLLLPQYQPLVSLDDYTTYSWQVITKNDFGETSGKVWTFTTEFLAAAGVDASDDFTERVRVTWAGVADRYYRVFRSTEMLGAKEPLSDWQTETVFDDTTAVPGVLYYYWVRVAVDANGNFVSEYSDVAEGRSIDVTVVDLDLFKVTFKNCTVTKDDTSLVVVDSNGKASIKIQASNTTPIPADTASVIYLEATSIPSITVTGILKKLYTEADIGVLDVTGTLPSVTTKYATIEVMRASAFGKVKMLEDVNGSDWTDPVEKWTSLYANGEPVTIKTASVSLVGVGLAAMQTPEQDVKIKAAAKRYKGPLLFGEKSFYLSLTGVGNDDIWLGSWDDDALSQYEITANGSLSISVKGGDIVASIYASGDIKKLAAIGYYFSYEEDVYGGYFTDAEITAGGKISTISSTAGTVDPLFVVAGGEIRKISAKNKNVRIFGDLDYFGGDIYIGDYVASGFDDAATKVDIGTISGATGVDGIFMAGVTFFTDGGSSHDPEVEDQYWTIRGRVKTVSVKKPSEKYGYDPSIDGEAWTTQEPKFKGGPDAFNMDVILPNPPPAQ